MKRSAKGNEKAGAVQQYIEQELEVHLSIVEAEKSLEELMECRAWITKQIESLRNVDDTTIKKKIVELEDDLALLKAQISDLQQKIITADQENKARTQWDHIQSMSEAKVALKCLFELLVDAKRELSSQSEKGFQARYDRLAMNFENSKAEFERQLSMVKLQSEQKAQRSHNITQADISSPGASAGAVKRRSDGFAQCMCKGSCSTKICGCQKSDKGCGNTCNCLPVLCKNRRVSSDSENNKENNPSSTELSLDTPPPSEFRKRGRFDATYVIKKKKS